MPHAVARTVNKMPPIVKITATRARKLQAPVEEEWLQWALRLS